MFVCLFVCVCGCVWLFDCVSVCVCVCVCARLSVPVSLCFFGHSVRTLGGNLGGSWEAPRVAETPPACVGGAWIWPQMRWGALGGPGPGLLRFFSGCRRAGRLVAKWSGRTPRRRGVGASCPKPPGTSGHTSQNQKFPSVVRKFLKKKMFLSAVSSTFSNGANFFRAHFRPTSGHLRAPPGTKPTKRPGPPKTPLLPDQGVSRPRSAPVCPTNGLEGGVPPASARRRGVPPVVREKKTQKLVSCPTPKENPQKLVSRPSPRKTTQNA